MEDLKQLILRRGQVKARLTRFRSFFVSCTEQDVTQLKLRLAKFECSWQDYEEIQSQIELKDQTQDSSSEREEFETNYFKLISEVELFISCHSSASVHNPTSQAHIKLPTLNLPTFTGSYDQWLNFRDTFLSLIHASSGLTGIQKFHYLRSALKDEAAQVIESLEISSDNYEVAWDLLSQRYENRRWIVQNHVKALFDLPALSKESHVSLRLLLDNTLKHLRALKALKQPVESWDTLLIHLITNKFDMVTKREWETIISGNQDPTLENIVTFLTNRCQILEALDQDKSNPKQPNSSSPSDKKFRNHQPSVSHVASNQAVCPVCNQNHNTFQCREFLKLDVTQRINKARELKLCFNCLKGSHLSDQCQSGSCKTCSKKHNTLLHLPPVTNVSPMVNNQTSTQGTSDGQAIMTATQTNTSRTFSGHIILSTAIVEVYDTFGKPHLCRALLDSGSQSNFLTAAMCSKLGLSPRIVNNSVSGVGQAVVGVNEAVTITLKSRFNAFRSTITCLLLPVITERLPSVSFDIEQLKIPNHLKLADPQFGVSSEIDLLIGAELFYRLLCVGQIVISRQAPVIQKTHLGWVVSGYLGNTTHRDQESSLISTCTLSLESQMSKFWLLEEVSVDKSWSEEEQSCENHFCSTVQRSDNGRYIVKLPLKRHVEMLGQSQETAVKRLYSLERKLQRQPDLKAEYIAFMQEYLRLGHMEQTNLQLGSYEQATYYLPHHAVVKPSSSTTKIRVVFDASAATTSGVSLNNILMVGPVIQQDLFALLTRFRTHNIVLTADIAKMYRQILVDQDQIDLQRIVWRESPDQPISVFRLKTVTYGTASAPFLATRCIQQVALDGNEEFPLASIVASRDFYVDDLLTGSETLEEARTIRNQLIELLMKRGFELRKWSSNKPELLSDLPINAVDTSALQVNGSEHIKTLGLIWEPASDNLRYIAHPRQMKVTKRNILSTIASIFDPLGLIGPVILKAKIFMQRLWQLQLSWDESVPINIHTSWIQYAQQLDTLNTLCIPRRVIEGINNYHLQLHGFCDASEAGYGACLYIRTITNDCIAYTNLLCSKSRVAPLKNISLPRLELCGAVLLARLAHRTTATLGLDFERCFFWTDSTIVLSWLASPPNTWKTFIANRVSEILGLTQFQEWHHIGTKDNPADHVSRGLSPLQISSLEVWWRGPSWLADNEQRWPVSKFQTSSSITEIPERRTISSFISIKSESFDIFDRYSSFSKLQRVIAYCLRFRDNTSLNRDKRRFGPLSVGELQNSLDCLVRLVQVCEFSSAIQVLNKGLELPSTSKLLSLHPFLDDKGILRVGGRLHNASISYAQKHPILLPSRHKFTRLLVSFEHIRQLHAGPQLLLSSIRCKFWPLAARSLVRMVVRQCIRCFRVRPVGVEQFMGDLPATRVTPSRPFLNSGVDFCGPFHLRLVRRRGGSTIKTYIAIFICFTTKAVHLELVSDLSTEAFLGALKRFIARRGHCAHIYSDNATNFVGADRQLMELQQLMESEKHQTTIANTLIQKNIIWHFIPARSPHFGGLWEAAVKSTKHHLRRVAGTASLTFEEMYTLVAQVEACLNSRPLTPLTDNLDDLNVLTPGHFLIGNALTTIAEPDLISVPINRLSHWQHVQQLMQHFWARWSTEYLSHLQQRNKWRFQKQHALLPGSLVILKEDNVPPLKWNLGRITAIHPGTDNLIRVVSVRTSTGIVKRAISRICILPLDDLPGVDTSTPNQALDI